MSFFDRMKDSLSVAGAEVSQKVSQTSDTLKWNNQIRNNEKEIEKIIYQVGAQCVKNHLSETETEYEALFSQIRRYQAENQHLQEQIQALNEACERQTQNRQQEMKERQEQRERGKPVLSADRKITRILNFAFIAVHRWKNKREIRLSKPSFAPWADKKLKILPVRQRFGVWLSFYRTAKDTPGKPGGVAVFMRVIIRYL